MEQDKQHTQNIPLWHISMITVHWKHNISLCVCCYWVTCHCQLHKNTEFCATVCNGKLMQETMQNYTYQCLKEITFHLICTWSSLDTQFEKADHNESHCIVSLFL